jgi:hypothetical protein
MANTQILYYDIDWDKVKTIKDVKSLLQILASKVVIDHNDEDDIRVFESLESILVLSDDQVNV